MGPPYSKPCSSPPLRSFFIFACRGPASAREVRTGPTSLFLFPRRKKRSHSLLSFFEKLQNKKHSSQTVVAALDMPLPEDYIRRLAPPPRSDSSVKCVVTGEPAKYRDPVTGAPYATVEAFKALRARGVVGSAAAAVQALKAASVAAAGEFFSSSFLSFQKTRSLCTEAPGFFYS